MKYFTPQRYVDFNSDTSSTADAADQEWERAINEYRKHLRKIRTRLPLKAREFAEKTCLHDANYLGFLKVSVPRSAGELALVAVQFRDQTVLLIYVLADEPTLSPRDPSEIFSEEQVHWLYDELDVLDENSCLHEILLSNGRILTMPFVEFDVLAVRKDDFDQLQNGQFVALAAT